MLPSASGKTRLSAIQSIIYCAGLLVISMAPYFMGFIGAKSACVIGITGIVFLWMAIDHFYKCNDQSAKKVLYTSFIYLPVVQLALVFGKY